MCVKSIVVPPTIKAFNCLTKLNKTMNKTFLVGLMAILLAVSMPCVSARKATLSKAPKAAMADIEFSVADQQFVITDQSFDVLFTLSGGAPNQIKFEPTQAAQDSGFNVVLDWEVFDPVNNPQISVPRPFLIKPGDYACVLSMRDSTATDSAVSVPFTLSVYQISFDMNKSAVVCGDDNYFTVALYDIVGEPNQIKLLVDTSIIKDRSVVETPWMPFNLENPYFTLDMSRIAEGVTITDGVQIGLRDSTTRDTTMEKVYATKVVVDTIVTSDSIDHIDTTTLYIIAAEDSLVYNSDSTQIDTVYLKGDTLSSEIKYDTIFAGGDTLFVETIVVDSTSWTLEQTQSSTAWVAHNFIQIGRGMDPEYLKTKFDNCLIFVDNSGRHNGAYTFSSYQWYKDGVRLEGATQQYYYETDANGNLIPLNGSYNVVVTTSEGLVKTLCPVNFSGAQNAPVHRSSLIYPNPVNEGQQPILQTFYSQEELDESVMRIYDLQGSLAYIQVGLSEYNILPWLPTNMYLVRIETPQQTETLKFIVK